MKTRLGLAVAAGREVSSLYHDHHHPHSPINPLPYPSQSTAITLRRQARHWSKSAHKRPTTRPVNDADASSSSPPSPNTPHFSKRKKKGSPAWNKLYQRHARHTQCDDPTVPISAVELQAHAALQQAHDEFNIAHEHWKEQHYLDRWFASTFLHPLQSNLDDAIASFWNEEKALTIRTAPFLCEDDTDDDRYHPTKKPPTVPTNSHFPATEPNSPNSAEKRTKKPTTTTTNAHADNQGNPNPPDGESSTLLSTSQYPIRDDSITTNHDAHGQAIPTELNNLALPPLPLTKPAIPQGPEPTWDPIVPPTIKSTNHPTYTNTEPPKPPPTPLTDPPPNPTNHMPHHTSHSPVRTNMHNECNTPSPTPNSPIDNISTPDIDEFPELDSVFQSIDSFVNDNIIENQVATINCTPNNSRPQPTKHTSTIYSQNCQGLWRRARDEDGNVLHQQPRDTAKFEKLIDKMRQDDIGAWLIQETWEEDDEFDVEIGGYHIFRHNKATGESGKDHLFKGVAIVLSPDYYQAWKAAGSPPPITTDPTSQFAGRFISITVK
ncbi:hypothetical protein ACHAXR_002261, partial [Thalassiosira sp. AJA248-18]